VWAADTGEDGADDLVAEREQGGDRAGCGGWAVVAVRAAGFDQEVFSPELAQVVGGLASGVVGVSGDRVDFWW